MVEVPEEFKTGAGIGLADKILKAKEAERLKAVKAAEMSKSRGKGKRWVSSPRSTE